MSGWSCKLQSSAISRNAAGVMVTPPSANGRSLTIRRVKQAAIALEKMNKAVAIAAGLPMWIMAVVMR